MNNSAENWRLGGGDSASSIHPVVLIATLTAAVLMLVLPRKYIAVPFLATVFLAPFGAQLYVAGAHLFVSRILVLAGWVRIASVKERQRTEIASGGFNRIDKVFLAWALFHAIATYLEYIEWQAIVNQVGFLMDAAGGYFLLRFAVRDQEDVERVIKLLVVVVAILATTMTMERIQAQNVFGYIGGRLEPFVRDGAIRAQGSFVGPIPAGTFGASIVCLFVWLWKSGKARFLAFLGVAASTVMVVTSASSTPLMTFPAGIMALFLWPLRSFMRFVRWGIVLFLIVLQLFMKAPVWMAINHIDLVGGNSSYHRAMLVDTFVRHFWDWWLIGVKSTHSWGWDMWDQANQFVAEGETGGLAAFICFVLVTTRSFAAIGTARRRVRGRREEWLFWCLGSTMFAFIVSFFGISFSDQSAFGWYAFLALISTTAFSAADPRPKQEDAASSEVKPELAWWSASN